MSSPNNTASATIILPATAPTGLATFPTYAQIAAENKRLKERIGRLRDDIRRYDVLLERELHPRSRQGPRNGIAIECHSPILQPGDMTD